MTVPYRILVGRELSFFERKAIKAIINKTFEEVDNTYNYWNPSSEISGLNRLKKNERKQISFQLKNFLILTEEIVKITEGRFDPTIGHLQKLWKDKLLTDDEVTTALSEVGWHKIHYEESIFWKDSDLVSLDLGGIAKGFCVDLLTERLQDAGCHDVYVEWGGEIRAGGHHPEGRPWRVFISRLGDLDPDHAIAIVDLNDAAIATSGDYLQNWEVNGTIYYHIINPKTGYPLVSVPNAVASASVLAPSCALADGLATALMMPGETKWIDDVPNIKYWIEQR